MLLLIKSQHNSRSFHWFQSYYEKQRKGINIQENELLSGICCDWCSSLLFLKCCFTLFSHCDGYSRGNTEEKLSIVFSFHQWRQSQIWMKIQVCIVVAVWYR